MRFVLSPAHRRLCAAALGAALAVPLLAAPSRAADSAVGTVVISEVRSSPNPDFVELHNTGDSPVSIAGWTVLDADPAHVPAVISADRTLAPGEYWSFDPDTLAGGFGLGSSDSVTVATADGTSVDEVPAWSSHRTPSAIRCGDDFVVSAEATPGASNTCPSTPVWESVRINEIESNGDKVADWVELKNTGDAPVDVSGWKILDADPEHAATPVVIPASTTIPAGGHYAIYTEIAQTPGFGLGAADSVTVYLADGTTEVDSHAWEGHAATTYGRCPDGTGDVTVTTTSTRGATNACSPIRLNEIESSDPAGGHDWVELVNIDDSPVDVSGWTLKDSGDADAFTIPTGTEVPAHGHLVLDDFAFGLGASDAARLFDGDALVDAYAWTAHAEPTYGRCKDGLGDFTTTRAATLGAANACPGLDTVPWDGGQDVRTSDPAGTFTADLSGLAFDPDDTDVLWAAQNKRGTLWRLVRDGDTWVPDETGGWSAGKDPKYTDGTGAPDTEGITVGPDGFLYAASERNNSASGVSRMSVLRYDATAAGSSLTASDEWDVTAAVNAAAGSPNPPIGANLGLEGVTFVPDAFLTDAGFVDQGTGQAYDPSEHPHHGGGLFVVAVEDTGHLYAFALDHAGASVDLVADIATGLPKLADVAFDPERERLWAVADDTVDGRTSLLKLVDGAFVPAEAYDRPGGMPNLNNEGLAIAAQSTCTDGVKEVVWSDDGSTDGHALRSGTLRCAAADPQPVVDPTITADVSGTRAASGWYRSEVTVTFTCEPGSSKLLEPCPEPVVLSTDGRRQSVSRTITAVDGGTATATVSGIDVDRTPPSAKVTGMSYVRLYTKPPKFGCSAKDALSGVTTCTLGRRTTGSKVVITATAKDRAGNVARSTLTYRIAKVTIGRRTLTVRVRIG